MSPCSPSACCCSSSIVGRSWLLPPSLLLRCHSITTHKCKGIPFAHIVKASRRVDAYLAKGRESSVLVSRPLDSEHIVKALDVATLGNLCVDIVLSVPSLPPPSLKERYEYMEKLAQSAPEQRFWEGGGNCNFALAAARLGLSCVSLGHVGDEKYGRFLHQVLESEGVQLVGIGGQNLEDAEQGDLMFQTLLCWVLVDSQRQHGFCSQFDFTKEPVFSWINRLPVWAETMIKQSKVLFYNGFLFDELLPNVICSSVEFANNSGCAVFFDPGPRGKSFAHGTYEQREILDKLLSRSDVLLLTQDEAEALTGIVDPFLSAQSFLDRGPRTKWVIIKMGERGCLMATLHGLFRVPAFKVDVVDTVGCGDSFAAAVVFGYIEGLPPVTILALANAVGAATAMGCGAGRNVATMDRVIKILLQSELLIQPDDMKALLQSREQVGEVKMTVVSNDVGKASDSPFLIMPIRLVADEVLDLLKRSQKDRS